MILLHRLRATNFKQIEAVDLTFPKSGTLLIEGRNEAGKSTLFDAIFYALYGKIPGDGDVLGAIRYGCESLEVSLDFSVEGRDFSVTRKHGQRGTASLTFPGADGQTERISTVAGVSKQIVEELQLSAQGLLNTCFVEQKKLEHLESLNKKQREEAINELVNLSALSRIEAGFPQRAEEQRQENAVKLRLIIAQLDSKYGELQTALLNLRPLHAAAQLGELNTAQETCRQTMNDLACRKTTLETLIALRERDAWLTNTMQPALSFWESEVDVEAKAQEAVKESENAQTGLPALKNDVERLVALEDKLVLYLRLQEEENLRKNWATSQEAVRAEVTRLTGSLTQAKQKWEAAQNAMSTAEKYGVLTEWARAKNALDAASSSAPDLQLAELLTAVEKSSAACDATKAQADSEERAAQTTEENARAVTTRTRAQIASERKSMDAAMRSDDALPSPVPAAPAGHKSATGVGLTALGLVCVIAAFVTGLWVLLVPAALLVGGGSMLIATQNKLQAAYVQTVRSHEESEAKRKEAVRKVWETAQKAAQEAIARLQKEDDEAQAAAQTARGMATAQARAHNESLVALAEDERRLSDYRINNDNSARLPILREELVRAEVNLASLKLPVPHSAEEAQQQAGEEPRLPKERLRQEVTDAQNAHEAASEALRATEARVVRYTSRWEFTDDEKEAIPLTPRSLQEANFTLAPKPLREAVEKATLAAQEAERLTGLLPTRRETWQSAAAKTNTPKEAFLQKARRDDTGGLFPKLAFGDAFETVTGARECVERMQHDVQEREAKEDAALLVLSLDALRNKKDEITGSESVVRQEMSGLISQEAAPRQTLGQALANKVALPDLLLDVKQTYPKAFEQDATHWQKQVSDAETETQTNRVERRTNAATAQITDAVLDEVVERAAYDACLFSREVNAKAKLILDAARTAILNRVMPGTLQITKRILPHLTENRYRDVQWDMDNNLIEVMDARKGDWAMKKVFSGGTRDQISLALRLSFVLATLPNHKATRPGWLFLDEPLSSFDAARSEKLVALLTQGSLIRPRFPQIFLISHGVAADPSRFDYHLIMDSGKISSASRLPTS